MASQSLPPSGPGRAEGPLGPLYEELRRLARARLRRERIGSTWQPTDLVHEVWLRVGDRAAEVGREDFLRLASVVMRHLLTDRARRARRLRDRLPDLARPVEGLESRSGERVVSVIDMDEALGRLEALDPRKARAAVLLELVGCTQEEAARTLGVSLATLKRDWSFARAWLRRELGGA
jgi:RNA polymerase sigma-70 factor, ECF subfamily